MTERYKIDGYEVMFKPWHGIFVDEDYVDVTVSKHGIEIFHAEATKLDPSEQQARKIVESIQSLYKPSQNGS